MAEGLIRLVVADDDVLVRSGLSLIFDSEKDLTVVGQAGSGREALAVVEQTRPDVVIMDVRMPDMDGIEATDAIVTRYPHGPRMLVLTTFEDSDYLHRTLRAGPAGSCSSGPGPRSWCTASGWWPRARPWCCPTSPVG